VAIEQKWPMVSPKLLTANGGSDGIIKVASTAGFKVKQIAILQAPSLAPTQVKIQRVVSKTELIVGPAGPLVQGKQNMNTRVDVSNYTLALGSFIFAAEQDKVKLKPEDILQAIYDQEPVVGIRSILVDQFGEYFDSVVDPLTGQRRLAVEANVNISSTTVQLLTKPYSGGTETYPTPTREIVTTYIGGISGGTPVQRVTLNYSNASKNDLVDFQREDWNGTSWVIS
jgi:hypothetical protein